MQEAIFDVGAALDAIKPSKEEKERWARLQEEERSKVIVGDGNAIYGRRYIDMAQTALQGNADVDTEMTKMAEGYYLLGEFQKAYDTTRDALKKSEYKEFVNAEKELCGCPDVRAGKLSLSPRFVIQTFPGKSVSRCTTCRRLFIT